MRIHLPAIFLAAVMAVPAAVPAAAETADIGFGRYDITCEGELIDVAEEMQYRGVTILEFEEYGRQYVLSVEFDPAAIALDDVVESLRRIGFHAFVLETPSAFAPKTFNRRSVVPGT